MPTSKTRRPNGVHVLRDDARVVEVVGRAGLGHALPGAALGDPRAVEHNDARHRSRARGTAAKWPRVRREAFAGYGHQNPHILYLPLCLSVQNEMTIERPKTVAKVARSTSERDGSPTQSAAPPLWQMPEAFNDILRLEPEVLHQQRHNYGI